MAAEEADTRGGREEDKLRRGIHKDKGGGWESQTWGEVAEIGEVRAKQEKGIDRLGPRSKYLYLVLFSFVS
ncbi:hypothetical protein BDZ91DRAFT_750003 [Kalaharituber pfeilii]|nr:hypothetical protein BDZ91DRAFT_750003 [Kalaharituber pfeilii]